MLTPVLANTGRSGTAALTFCRSDCSVAWPVIGPDTQIVLYGDNNNWFDAWAYWQLKLYGVENVKLLNGGKVTTLRLGPFRVAATTALMGDLKSVLGPANVS